MGVAVARYLLVWPATLLWTYVLAPVGRAIGWLLRVLVAVPLQFLWQYVLAPVGRAIGAVLAYGWRGAGYVLRAVGLGVAWLFRVLIAIPVAFVWRWTGAPFFRAVAATGRWVNRNVLRPVRQAVAEARRTVRRALFGAPREEPLPYTVPPHTPTAVPPKGVEPPALGAFGPPPDMGESAPPYGG